MMVGGVTSVCRWSGQLGAKLPNAFSAFTALFTLKMKQLVFPFSDIGNTCMVRLNHSLFVGKRNKTRASFPRFAIFPPVHQRPSAFPDTCVTVRLHAGQAKRDATRSRWTKTERKSCRVINNAQIFQGTGAGDGREHEGGETAVK